MDLGSFDLIVVGSGFFGMTVAERAAAAGRKVAVLERRPHIGGNSYSEIDPATGIEVHRYGSHLFHTNSEEVWSYLRQFTEFTRYRHRVFTVHAGRVYSMPINLGTLANLFGRHLTPSEAKAIVATEVAAAAIGPNPRNLEDKAISLMGTSLYRAFIRGYTKKQWQVDPRELPPEVITRLPIRWTFEDYYFADRYEGLPVDGYTAIFTKMSRSPRIALFLGVDYFAVKDRIRPDQLVVYTGPIDRFFEHRAGALTWRTLDFEREVVNVPDFQGTAVLNYADEDVPYTRIHEFRHLHPERKYQAQSTVIFREFSRFAGKADEPYYPVDTAADRAAYDAYHALATAVSHVVFGGRLGTYRYLDMHQAIGAALKAFESEIAPRLVSHAHAGK